MVGGEEAVLVGGVGAGFDHEVLAVAGAADAEVEALVLFVEDEGVLLGGGAEGVAEEVVLALGGLVFGGVEEGARVGGPGDGADALGGVGQVVSGAEVADVEGVLAEAGVVGGVGEEVAVGGDRECAEAMKGLPSASWLTSRMTCSGSAGSGRDGTATGPRAGRREWMGYWLPSRVRVR